MIEHTNEHLSDHDLERYHLGMIRDEARSCLRGACDSRADLDDHTDPSPTEALRDSSGIDVAVRRNPGANENTGRNRKSFRAGTSRRSPTYCPRRNSAD